MKIIENYNPEGVLISTIKPGELFIFDGKYMMRTKDFEGEPKVLRINTDDFTASIPCVDLATGEMRWIYDEEMVPPIYARIRINGRAD